MIKTPGARVSWAPAPGKGASGAFKGSFPEKMPKPPITELRPAIPGSMCLPMPPAQGHLGLPTTCWPGENAPSQNRPPCPGDPGGTRGAWPRSSQPRPHVAYPSREERAVCWTASRYAERWARRHRRAVTRPPQKCCHRMQDAAGLPVTPHIARLSPEREVGAGLPHLGDSLAAGRKLLRRGPFGRGLFGIHFSGPPGDPPTLSWGGGGCAPPLCMGCRGAQAHRHAQAPPAKLGDRLSRGPGCWGCCGLRGPGVSVPRAMPTHMAFCSPWGRAGCQEGWGRELEGKAPCPPSSCSCLTTRREQPPGGGCSLGGILPASPSLPTWSQGGAVPPTPCDPAAPFCPEELQPEEGALGAEGLGPRAGLVRGAGGGRRQEIPRGPSGGGEGAAEGLVLLRGRGPPVHHPEQALQQLLPPVEVTELLRYGPAESGVGEVFQGVNVLP